MTEKKVTGFAKGISLVRSHSRVQQGNTGCCIAQSEQGLGHSLRWENSRTKVHAGSVCCEQYTNLSSQ